MPAARPPATKGLGLGGKRIAGLPAPVVLGGLVLAVAGGLYLRHRSAGSSAATSPASATDPSGVDTSGGAGSSAASPQDLTPYTDLANAIGDLTYVLGSGSTFQLGSSAGGDGMTSSTGTTSSTSPSDVVFRTDSGGGFSPTGPSTTAPTAPPPPNTKGPLSGPLGAHIPTPTEITWVVTNPPKTAVPIPAPKIPEPPVHAATKVMPAPTAKQITAGQKAVNEKPVITPKGRAV